MCVYVHVCVCAYVVRVKIQTGPTVAQRHHSTQWQPYLSFVSLSESEKNINHKCEWRNPAVPAHRNVHSSCSPLAWHTQSNAKVQSAHGFPWWHLPRPTRMQACGLPRTRLPGSVWRCCCSVTVVQPKWHAAGAAVHAQAHAFSVISAVIPTLNPSHGDPRIVYRRGPRRPDLALCAGEMGRFWVRGRVGSGLGALQHNCNCVRGCV